MRSKLCYVGRINSKQCTKYKYAVNGKDTNLHYSQLSPLLHTVKVIKRHAGMVGASFMYQAETCLLTPLKFKCNSGFLVNPLYNYILASLLHTSNDSKAQVIANI